MKPGLWTALEKQDEFKHNKRGSGDGSGEGNREDPGPDDLSGYSPPHRRETLRRPYPGNGSGNGMRGADRDPRNSGADQRHRPRGFSAETATGLSFVSRIPIVLTMRQPPARVPRPIAAWADSTTHRGT